jgi:thiamine pyrophosphate-dependent acetolactate synthase large subunit-like protein
MHYFCFHFIRTIGLKNIEQQFTISGNSIPPIDEKQYASILAGKNLEESRDFLDNQASITSYTLTLQPQFLIQELHRLTKGEAIVATGVGQHQMWASIV